MVNLDLFQKCKVSPIYKNQCNSPYSKKKRKKLKIVIFADTEKAFHMTQNTFKLKQKLSKQKRKLPE